MCLHGIIFSVEFRRNGSLHTGQSISGSLSLVMVISCRESMADLGAALAVEVVVTLSMRR